MLSLLSACAETSQKYAPVPAPVPQAQPESVPLPPVSSKPLLWQPGHYEWNGAEFVWYKGEWIERADRSTLWQDGFWQKQGSIFVWVPGHWVS